MNLAWNQHIYTPFFIIWLMSVSGVANGQRIPSSCNAPDSIEQQYYENAQQLAIRRVFRANMLYKDSIDIPNDMVDTVLNAMMAVYNLQTNERDSVIDFYSIHSRESTAMKQVSFEVDTNLKWVQNLKNGIRPVGQTTIDSVLSRYNFKVRSMYTRHNSSVSTINLVLQDSNFNVVPISEYINTLDEVDWVCVDYNRGDGDNIWDSVHVDHVELLFSIGRNDCPSGCIYRKHWRFKVYFDCSVEFIESFKGGNPNWVETQRYDYQVPCLRKTTSTFELSADKNVQLFPNPAKDVVTLIAPSSGYYVLYSSSGQALKRGEVTGNNTEIDISGLQTGCYLLQFQDEEVVKNMRFIKR